MNGLTRLPRFNAIVLAAGLAALSSCSSGKSGPPTSPLGSLELDSGDFGTGATYEHRFAVAGTFAYHCIHHAAMTGSVQVSPSATDTLATVSITSALAPFPSATVRPGGRVVWTNNTGMLHTVTSN